MKVKVEMNVVILDPALENSNAGDEIISAAIAALDVEAFRNARRITTHRFLGREERRAVSAADVVILGGTNAVSSHMERFRQWPVDPDLARRLRSKLLLLGVGWWQYQEQACRYTRALLRGLSHPDLLHSVRDVYTQRQLASIGIDSVMTGCPTVWRLHSTPMATGRRDRAVVTVTDYYQNPEADRAWLSVVRDQYREVVCVGMGPGDQAYFGQLAVESIPFAGNGLEALSSALPDADHVGTRLHAGVHALSLGSPSLVLAVDNRASEMRESIGLAVVEREDHDAVAKFLAVGGQSELRLPHEQISTWLAQFAG